MPGISPCARALLLGFLATCARRVFGGFLRGFIREGIAL